MCPSGGLGPKSRGTGAWCPGRRCRAPPPASRSWSALSHCSAQGCFRQCLQTRGSVRSAGSPRYLPPRKACWLCSYLDSRSGAESRTSRG